MSTLGKRIRELREALGLSRSKMSDRTGVPERTFVSIEVRGSSPGGETIQKIAESLPCYALWLVTGEDAPLSGQFSPPKSTGDMSNRLLAYQVIDVVDARCLNTMLVNPSAIEKVLFLQTTDVPVAEKVKRLLNETIYHKGKFAPKQSDGASWGTAALLITSGANSAGFKRVVLAKSGSFDLLEIRRTGRPTGVLGSISNWCERHGVHSFDVAEVNDLTLQAIEAESDELKISDLYPPSEAAKESLSLFIQHTSFSD